MVSQGNDSDVKVYVSKRDIPWYQRDWVWGTAALLILLCGLVAGWLAKPQLVVRGQQARGSAAQAASPEAMPDLLHDQEATNQALREQIARLETVMQGDICSSSALDAVTPIVGATPSH